MYHNGAALRRCACSAGLGSSLALLDDWDGDGVRDFLAGAPGENNVGAAYVFSAKCGWHPPYGAGCAGTGGQVPTMTMTTCVNVGEPLMFTLDDGLPLSTALLVIGGGMGSTPVLPGCALLVAPLYPFLTAIPLGPTGSSALFATVPMNAAGQTFALQTFVVDPGAGGGFAATAGLLLQPK